MLNEVNIMGRIGADVVLKTTPQGTSVMSFPLAVQKKYKDESGNRQVSWIDCVAWRENAEFIARNFRKGNLIIIVGHLDARYYEANGKTIKATEVIVDSVEFSGEKAVDEQ